MSRVQVEFRNDFHNTSAYALVGFDPVAGHGVPAMTRGQVKSLKHRLCGVKGCACSNDLGMRGKQNMAAQEVFDKGRFML